MIGPMLHVASRLVLGSMPLVGGAAEAAAVSGAPLPGVDIDGANGNGLRIEWSVEKTRGSSPNQGTITVYNINPALRQMLSAAMALPVPLLATLLVGWDRIPELLFAGEVWRLVPARHTGTDVLTVIEAADGAAALRDTPPAGGAVFGMAMSVAVGQILGQLRLTPSPTALAVISAAAAAVPAAASMRFVNDRGSRALLDEFMASIGLTWGIEGGEFVVYASGLRNDLLPSILSPTSGLLRWEELDDGGIEFEGLAQARVVPGLQVQILDAFGVPQGGGPLRVERVTFTGTSEGPSTMTGTARKVQVL